ncbi:hypothetical protein [uncultured Paraglaciecola sp.]|uniref:hypothetical protein n=1 Tax=uncultured Paraglaciecola sp. TaxID=1765024 RepID=UPI00262BA842|nr:hypothetical protein [uncultured Paraglaciecola sp.]
MTKPKKPLSGGAIANQERKKVRINVALEALKNIKPTLKFKSRTEIYLYLADTINMYEKQAKVTTSKGPCSRSGVYSIPEIKVAVEKFWVTGILVSDDVDLYQTVEAAAKKALMDKDLEISNLKHQLSEKTRFLDEADNNVRKLTKFIKSTDLKSPLHALGNADSSVSQQNTSVTADDSEKLIEDLCQVIYKLEVWADNLIERQSDGALVDAGLENEIVSAKLMREYHKRVPMSMVKE